MTPSKIKISVVLFLSIFLINCTSNFKKSESEFYINVTLDEFIIYEVKKNDIKAYNFEDSTIVSIKNYNDSLIKKSSFKKIDIGNIDISCLNNKKNFWCHYNNSKRVCNKIFVNKGFLLNYGSQNIDNNLYNPLITRKAELLNFFDKFYVIKTFDISQSRILLTNLTEDTLQWSNIDSPEFITTNTNHIFKNDLIIGKWKIVNINHDDDFLKIDTEIFIDRDHILVKNINAESKLFSYFIGSNLDHIYYYENDGLDLLFISEVGISTFKLQRAYTNDVIELSR